MISCPACGGLDAIARFSVTAHEAAQHFALAEGECLRHDKLEDCIRSLWDQSSCDIVECSTCQLRFAWPFIGGDSEFYNLAYPNHIYPESRWEFSKTVDILEKRDVKGGKLLEIGSGSGYFLDRISPRFIDRSNVVAAEYDNDACSSLRRKGFDVLQRDIRSGDFDKFEGVFSYIVMFQVLEHMDFLNQLAARLRFLGDKGAELFVAVPNRDWIEFNEQHDSLLDMPPNHISCWTEKAFRAFGERAGYRVEEFQFEPMSWLSFIKQDITFSYMRRAQRHGSVENFIRAKRRTRLRRMEEAAYGLCTSPRRFGAWIAAATGRRPLGGSVWVHLQRD